MSDVEKTTKKKISKKKWNQTSEGREGVKRDGDEKKELGSSRGKKCGEEELGKD